MNNQRTFIKSISCDKNTLGVTRGKVICLRREGTSNRGVDYFKINGIVGQGGACVCYDATLMGEGKTGRLKEFYPTSCFKRGGCFALERDSQNHIIASEEISEDFALAKKEFVEAYHVLRGVMEKNKNNSDFTSFIPDFSIYYACDAEGNIIENSTAYIWTAPENLTVFEKYIEDIRKHPTVYPEHKLFTILKTTIALTESVKILHENGLLHLDIKPGNFGIPQRKGKLLTDSITLFDVNTIYSYNDVDTAVYGTEGFCAPEVISGQADNTSDIYSIGCTLFSALMVNDEIETLGYSKRYYTKLGELLDSSKLIAASEINSNVSLKYELLSILKKCLAESQSKRYQSCVDLVNDLERALAYLYPYEINASLPLGKKMIVLERELDKKRGISPYLTCMYHLYKKTLFEYVPAESESVEVLIVGFGNYGQSFLDCCLQTGQILGKKLNVRVISNDHADGNKDRSIYLAARPTISEFFSIDGNNCEAPYGYICFESREFARGDLKKNKEIAAKIASQYNKSHYVFVALGDDMLNKNVAQAIYSSFKGVKECSVNFAYDGEEITGRSYGNPIYMSRDITAEPLYRDIERMAFNAHLIWESGLNIDLAKSYAKFKDLYNYNSSFSNAVAIKYKLYSFGIAMDDLTVAAAQYYEKIVSSSKHLKNELMALEHRRWVCEKICLGWVRNQNLESCLTLPPNDKKSKRHVTLVRSTPATPLQTPYWTLSKWDTAGKEDLDALDELDRVSVRLHQVYKNEADRIKRESTLLDSTMLQLKNITKKNESVSIAFSEWYSCLSLLWNSNDNPSREYDMLKDELTESLAALSDKDAKTAKVLIELIDARFSIILNSMRYVDYKNHDANFVNYIPFILTHKRDTHLVIPFSQGSNTKTFSNVAAATIVNPHQITYLVYISKKKDAEDFLNALDYVLNYMAVKDISAKINFVILHCKDEKIQNAVEQLKSKIANIKTEIKINKIVIKEAENESHITECICEAFNSKIKIDAVEQNDTPLSSFLLGAGFYLKYPHYRFDINTRKFYGTVGCEFLKYIKAEQYLRVSDMFASKNSKGYLESPSAFYNDYENLWEKAYRKKEFLWKKMCGLLEAYHKTEDRILTISTDALRDKESFVKYRFLVPAGAYEGVNKLISVMEEAEIFGKESEVYYYTTDSCEVNIYAPKSIGDKLKSLMADPYIFIQPENLDLVKTPYSVIVSFDYLTVKSLDLKPLGKHADRVKELLVLLEEKFSFITGYTEFGDDGQLVSFTYATKRIKKLLTNAGKILEIYVYHKCLKSDLFDDVAMSYEISWDGTSVKSEFDIILTKGFSGLLIEAKATEGIDQDYYFKLACLAEQFGTNCRPVLVADTVEKWFNDNSANDMQRLRGDMLEVVTISDPEKIDEIDVELARLLDIDVSHIVEARKQEKKQVDAEAVKKSTQKSVKMSQEEFLAQKVTVLPGLTSSQIAILQNNGVHTVKDFLNQTEESLSNMRAKNGIAYTSLYLSVQSKIREKLEDILE